MPARHLTIVRYPPGEGWRCAEIRQPSWLAISAAIRAMDDDEFPWIQLSWKKAVASCGEDEQSLNIMGGADAGFAVFEFMGRWQFEDPLGSNEDVRLWQSDQGYYCKRKNIIADVGDVLMLAQVYFETGSYEALERASAQLRSKQNNR
jgi:hypothetical protein